MQATRMGPDHPIDQEGVTRDRTEAQYTDDPNDAALSDLDPVRIAESRVPIVDAPQSYRVYKTRWFGLGQLVLLNIVVSWDVSELRSRLARLAMKDGTDRYDHSGYLSLLSQTRRLSSIIPRPLSSIGSQPASSLLLWSQLLSLYIHCMRVAHVLLSSSHRYSSWWGTGSVMAEQEQQDHHLASQCSDRFSLALHSRSYSVRPRDTQISGSHPKDESRPPL